MPDSNDNAWKITPYLLEVRLEQHTPMLHFQGEENDVVLRASEVKPKLDRFLSERLGNELDSRWKQGAQGDDEEGRKALKYRMWFTGSVQNNENINSYPCYFGDERSLVMWDDLTMHISSKYSRLLELMTAHLQEFFLLHNFGTRQSKGFGYFYPKGCRFDCGNPDYCLKMEEEETNYEVLFREIGAFHTRVRNLGIKSYVDELRKEEIEDEVKKRLLWDKPVIASYFGLPCKKKIKKEELSNYVYLFRDALGLSCVHEWPQENKRVKIEPTERSKVHRFQSPIQYRPYYQNGEWVVYIYLQALPSELKYSDFQLKCEKTGSKDRPSWRNLKQMSVYPNFNLHEFFDFLAENSQFEELQKI